MSDDPYSYMETRLEDRLRRKASRFLPKDGFKGGKTVNEVIDRPTAMTLYKMISAGIVSGVDGAVGAGKESLLFRGRTGKGRYVALKVYLIATSNFKRRTIYMKGDPQFSRFRKNTRHIVYKWAQKEFRNLQMAHTAGIPVPEPIKVANNVLAMEFIGDGGRPAPILLHQPVDDSDYAQAVDILVRLYLKAGLVHGDFSAYNIFKTAQGLTLFDLGSAVGIQHPSAHSFLKRDINNINTFFAKRRVAVRSTNDITGEIL